MDKPAAVSETVPKIPWDMPTADRDIYTLIASKPPESRALLETLFKKYADLCFQAISDRDAVLVSSQTASAEGDGKLPENLVEGIEWWKNGENPAAFTESGLRDFINDLIKHVSVGKVAEGDGWIAVTERLPEEGRLCITFGHGVVQHALYSLDDETGDWTPADEDFDRAPFGTFTHWRPLPAPPVNEEGTHE